MGGWRLGWGGRCTCWMG